MKKLLAFLLAVTMIATLIPSAFADEGEATDKIEIVCDLQNLIIEHEMYGSGCTVPLSTLNYTNTDGAFRYLRSSLTSGESFDVAYADTTATNKLTYPGAKPTYDNRGFISLFKGNWIAFEVNVPQDGNYTLKLNHKKAKAQYAGLLKVYMTEAEKFYVDGSFGTSLNGTGINTTDTSETRHSDSIANVNWADNQVIFTDKKLTAGKYVVIYSIESGATLARVTIGNFSLEGTPIEEEPEEPAEPETKKAVIYNVAQIMHDNDVHYTNQTQDGCAEAEKMTYQMTNGLFEVADARGNITIGGTGGTLHNFLKMGPNATVDFKVNVPEDGTYFLNVNHQLSNDGGTVSVYADGEYVGSYNCKSAEDGVPGKFASGDTSVWKNDVLVTENGIELSAGEHVISYSARNGYGMISYFELANENLVADSVSLVYIDKTTLEIDETATISGAVVSSLDGTVKAQIDDNTTYASSNTNVVTVNGRTVTAVGTGTADITATVGDITAKRTITVIDKAATDEVETVQFMATSTIADNAGVSTEITGYKVGETTDEIAPGTTVKVIADPVSGYIFRGWKRGSKDNGVWLSTSETYSFPLLTNTYLTAVYDVDTATDAAVNVEFYNFNGQFLASKPVDENDFATLASDIIPTLTGYNEYFWTINGTSPVAGDTVFNKLTRVVAKFTDKDSFNVTVPENVDSNKASGKYEYDTEIKMTAAADGFWKVNGEVVAYGESYTYIVWSEAVITFEAKENDGKPIISLDPETTDGARMISYDANDAEIVEAGILFGENATINSANSRAVSRDAKGNVSGQFTAKPYSSGDANNATAYLIYNDNGTYRVIYAD